MSDTHNTTAVDTSATDSDEHTDSGTSGTPDAENGSQADSAQKGNREARYRTERNAAREELAAAQARIDRMHRAEVERLAAAALSHPADLFSLSGNELTDYLTEDGMVDPEKVAADVAAILQERPGLKRNTPAVDHSQGRGGKGTPKRKASWETMLNPEK